MYPTLKVPGGGLKNGKKLYNIKRVKICGESGEVSGETVASWKEQLPEIVKNYSNDDIWNLDESGVFWQALPDSGFGQKGNSVMGGSKVKKRITVAFFVSAAGKSKWKSENLRCLKWQIYL